MTNPADPASIEEYNARFAKSQTVTGYGLETASVSPCPFCAAPDWMTMPMMDVRSAMEKGATCKACGRSAKAVFTSRDPSNISFEMVQTGGDDPAPWLPPMRRV